MWLTVEAVSMRFGRLSVFDDFSATFADHALTALVGPSGSGKTTLLSLMAGYAEPSAGRVRVHWQDGAPATAPDPSLVAWVPQGSNALGARSALDNVLIGALSDGRPLAEATDIALAELDLVGVADLADVAARDLSGGELQRVCFARALASGRPIIFADEPSASLDAASTEQLAEALEALRSTRLVVVATHDPILMSRAQNTVAMRMPRP